MCWIIVFRFGKRDLIDRYGGTFGGSRWRRTEVDDDMVEVSSAQRWLKTGQLEREDGITFDDFMIDGMVHDKMIHANKTENSND